MTRVTFREAFALPDPRALGLVMGLLAVTLVAGYFGQRRRPGVGLRWTVWLGALAGVVLIERICSRAAPGFRMLALIGILFLGMKAVVLIEARAAGLPALSWQRWLAFSTAWFGMVPAVFAREARPLPGAKRLFRRGVRRALIGLVLLGIARALAASGGNRIGVTIIGLVGLSLILHFGIFNVVAAFWRRRGFDCRPLFRSPLGASRLGEFWGRRWNLGFSEMVSLAVFRPLTAPFGRSGAVVISFLFSGLLHEVAISVPVRGGYGLPTVYFLLHGAAIIGERALSRRGIALGEWSGRVWCWTWLALPLPLLVHEPCRREIIWPLLGA